MGVVWTSAHEGDDPNVYFAESIDRGASYGTNYMLTPSPDGIQQEPAIAYDAQGLLHVFWENALVPAWDYDIHYASSADSGITFSEPERVNDDPPEPVNFQQQVAAAGLSLGGAVVVWLDSREAGDENIYFAGPSPSQTVDDEETSFPSDNSWLDSSHGNPAVRVFPNPIRKDAWFRASAVKVLDLRGRLRREIDSQNAYGCSWIHWDGRDQTGRTVEPGTYFLQMHSGPTVTTGRIVIVR
ncbi:MAG: hypothetical protein KAY24_02090 [Candidatus Eisenbacteria sp.]|nr:hypothetical protein [Candidatus Eisenbacteria bacterium]